MTLPTHADRFTKVVATLFLFIAASCESPACGDEPLRALQRHPDLATFFPYGFWYSQAPMDEQLAGEFREPTFESRRGKLFHHLARNHTNVLITANRVANEESLAAAGKFGIRLISSAEFLHSHVNHAGEVTGSLTMEQVKANAAAHALAVKDNPHLLAYLVFDEPRPKVAPKIQQVIAEFRRNDPQHPAIFTQSNMPLDPTQAAEWRLIASQDVLLSDCYSIAARSGRDPWLYGDVYVPELRRANPDALQWPIVQAFTKPYTIWALPTPAELRVQVYHTIASGAKGMFFFTTGQTYLGSWARHLWFYRGAGNPWYGREELMEEIGRIGEHLTTAGPLLLPLRYAPDYPVHVGRIAAPLESAEMFQAYVLGSSREAGDGGLRLGGEIERAAIHVGAFSGTDYDVLVVHNNDPWKHRSAAVTFETSHQNLLDLKTLETVPLVANKRGVSFSVDLRPGDGRLFLAGPAAAVDAARAAVRRRRAAHLRRLLQVDMEIAGRGKVDLRSTRALLARAAEADSPAAQLDLMSEARDALASAENSASEYATVRTLLDGARQHFDEIHLALHDAPIHPLDEDSDSTLRGFGRRVIEMSRSFTRNENAFRAGELDQTSVYVLRREAGQLKDAVLAYRPAGLIEEKIGVVELTGNAKAAGDAETRALAQRLRWMYTDVDLLTADAAGELLDSSGAAADLKQLDLLWLHVGGRSSAANSDYCKSADLAEELPRKEIAQRLNEFLSAGGGVVLSGLAGRLVAEMGLETLPPNRCYWGTMIVPGFGPSRFRPAAKPPVTALGLRPRVANHPVFAGLPATGFPTMEYNAADLVTAAVWQRPPGRADAWGAPYWPQRGRVLAGYWSDGLEIPNNYATVVEYAQPARGTTILLGGIDPRTSTNRPRRGEHYDRLLRNVVAHCARKN
ncbi:MAG: hypothetical protein QGG36_19190 [Pirellulaceae bacterium]|nr:hypothetical protein [Pirellulaceae bacterium]